MDYEETILFESNRIRTTKHNKTLKYNCTFGSFESKDYEFEISSKHKRSLVNLQVSIKFSC